MSNKAKIKWVLVVTLSVPLVFLQVILWGVLIFMFQLTVNVGLAPFGVTPF